MFRPDHRGAVRRELDALVHAIREGLSAFVLAIARAFESASRAFARIARLLSDRPPKRGRKRLSRRRGSKWREKQSSYILPFRRNRDAS